MKEGTGLVRFVWVPDFSKIIRFGSVRFGQLHFPVRRGSACVFRTRRGSVRFGSVRFRVRFRPVPELNGSVRFGSAGFGSVSYSFLIYHMRTRVHCTHRTPAQKRRRALVPGIRTTRRESFSQYGVRAPVFCGNLREQAGESGFPRIPTGNMFCSSGNLRKTPGVYGIMQSRHPVFQFPLIYPNLCHANYW